MSKYGTPFVESEAILAAQENDLAEVDRLVAGMLPNELRALYEACEAVQVSIATTVGAMPR